MNHYFVEIESHDGKAVDLEQLRTLFNNTQIKLISISDKEAIIRRIKDEETFLKEKGYK